MQGLQQERKSIDYPWHIIADSRPRIANLINKDIFYYSQLIYSKYSMLIYYEIYLIAFNGYTFKYINDSD